MMEFDVKYYIDGVVVGRKIRANSFMEATVRAGTNIKYRGSLRGATIRSIKVACHD